MVNHQLSTIHNKFLFTLSKSFRYLQIPTVFQIKLKLLHNQLLQNGSSIQDIHRWNSNCYCNCIRDNMNLTTYNFPEYHMFCTKVPAIWHSISGFFWMRINFCYILLFWDTVILSAKIQQFKSSIRLPNLTFWAMLLFY